MKTDYQAVVNLFDLASDVQDLVKAWHLLQEVHHELFFNGQVSDELKMRLSDYFEDKPINTKI